jgi:G6PDH family F420-dependent oxidoreductase
MVAIGYFLGPEEHSSSELVAMAVAAERAGFTKASIADHYHPWLPEQGHSPFVWSVLGALAEATRDLEITTAVVCPTVRIHPAIVAQASATAQQLLGGRLRLGVGTGEALNEHITGQRWPSPGVRVDMLAEAVDIIRRLWSGQAVNHHGPHYTVENARLWTLPDAPPPLLMSAFGPASSALAARVAEGFYASRPAKEALGRYREHGGTGPAVGQLKVCYDEDEERAVATTHAMWRQELIPGHVAQELPSTTHFQEMASIVTPAMVAGHFTCGPSLDRHLAAIQQYADAGFDEVHVMQIGSRQQEMIDFYAQHVLPEFA